MQSHDYDEAIRLVKDDLLLHDMLWARLNFNLVRTICQRHQRRLMHQDGVGAHYIDRGMANFYLAQLADAIDDFDEAIRLNNPKILLSSIAFESYAQIFF